MILLANLDNVSFSVAVYSTEKEKIVSFKTYADKLKSEVEYEEELKRFFNSNHYENFKFDGGILSSVVPSMTKRIQKALNTFLEKPCLVVGRKIKTSLALRVDNPSEVGSDLIASSIGALADYKEDVLIVNISSVCSFSLVSNNNEFLGCSFFPGLRQSAETMWSNCAQLIDTDLEIPNKLIGKNTKDSLNSGIVGGYICLIKNFADEIEREYKKPLTRILTGDDMAIVKNALFSTFECNPNLIFDGLYEIYQKNNKERE